MLQYKVKDWPVGSSIRHERLGEGKLIELENLVLQTLLASAKLPGCLTIVRINLDIELGVTSKPDDPAPADLRMFQYKVQIEQPIKDDSEGS